MVKAVAAPSQRLAGLTVLLSVLGCLGIGASLLYTVLDEWPPFIFLVAYFGFDLSIVVIVSIALLAVQRPNVLGALLAATLPLCVIGASTIKVMLLGEAALFEDSMLLGDLRRTLMIRERLAADLILGILALLFLANLRLGRDAMRAWLRVLVAAVFSVVIVLGMARSPAAFAYLVARIPPPPGDFPLHGHVANAVQVSVATARDASWARNVAAVPTLDVTASARLTPRNVHMVIVESFIDPIWLPDFQWPEEPLSAVFGRWRRESGSTALVPIFGSRSSNSEFEALCGLPVIGGPSAVMFLAIPPDTRLPCLPRILAQRGFATISLMPSDPRFFRARRAFEAMGFDRRLFIDDLDVSDLDGPWLSAEATLAQTSQAAEAFRSTDPTRPVFAYTFIVAGHYPYYRDHAKRPDRLVPRPHDGLLQAWANAAHYNARALDTHIAHIRRTDPAAIVVVLGDHNPALRANFATYRAGGRVWEGMLAAQRATVLHETPLLVLDGDRLVRTGRLPAWQIPDLVLDLLSAGEHCRDRDCGHLASRRLRPLHDVILNVAAFEGEEWSCPRHVLEADAPTGPQGGVCREARERTAAMHATLLRLLERKSE